MKLYPEGKTAPEVETTTVATQTKTAIKTYIKSLELSDEGKYYDEIIKEVQDHYKEDDKHYTNDVVLECLEAVNLEYHPVIEEVVEEELAITK